MDKILKIQEEIGVLVKDKENPYFKSQYLDINSLLEQLIPLLVKYKLTVIQPLHHDLNGKPILKTIVYDGDKELVNVGVPLPTEILQKNKDGSTLVKPLDSQEYGSAITYFRRYALQSLFLIRAEDDDGNSASKPIKKVGTNIDEDLGF